MLFQRSRIQSLTQQNHHFNNRGEEKQTIGNTLAAALLTILLSDCGPFGGREVLCPFLTSQQLGAL